MRPTIPVINSRSRSGNRPRVVSRVSAPEVRLRSDVGQLGRDGYPPFLLPHCAFQDVVHVQIGHQPAAGAAGTGRSGWLTRGRSPASLACQPAPVMNASDTPLPSSGSETAPRGWKGRTTIDAVSG